MGVEVNELIAAIRQGIHAHERLDRAQQTLHEELHFRDPVEAHRARQRLARAQERTEEANRVAARALTAWVRASDPRCVCSVTPAHVPCPEHDR